MKNSLRKSAALFTTLLLIVLASACGTESIQLAQDQQSVRAHGENGAANGEEEAANEVYLSDLEESAAENYDGSGEIDDSVTEDMKLRRLEQLVAMIMSNRDLDESGDLTLEEFLTGPGSRKDKVELDEERAAKITAKLTEDFNAFSGDDALLSTDELRELLKQTAPRVGRHRAAKFKGRHQQRVEKSWEDIISEYDANGDGLISQDEFSALRSDRKQERRGPHFGHRRGPFPGAPVPPPVGESVTVDEDGSVE